MEQLIEFFLRHWELSLLFILLFAAVIIYEWRSQLMGPQRVTPQEVISLINYDKAIVLDVRGKDVFKQGHIINALSIAIEDLEKDLKKIHKHKSKPIVVVCGSGMQQSAKVAEKLEKAEFSDVKILAGGIDAWRNANLPLEKG